MTTVIWQILPILLSVMSSPIALLAVLAMMSSSRPRANCIAYAKGWVTATAAALALTLVLLSFTGITDAYSSPVGLRIVHAVLAIGLFGGSWWSYRKAQAAMQRVAAALPVVVPILMVWSGDASQTVEIRRIRDWTLHHNGFVRAGLLALVGFLQLTRAREGWLL
ncbi:hypothetical protein [Gordonia sp. (in: high G+C Gram-positive bacteria)]|uniref:hypothetical protein n=1 Tax=Gordonia sp. (in: high G+C Gram-positive bacteria) TaxID=84139 RepID=UPI001695151E|nr:hypothetical protein [Gordonia sp. (in: high G+C Gram-positive bacteria)]NLG46265.1 hypothetical protein [Gordonia sp. (in: high G+C Gram-positive bacteria)]